MNDGAQGHGAAASGSDGVGAAADRNILTVGTPEAARVQHRGNAVGGHRDRDLRRRLRTGIADRQGLLRGLCGIGAITGALVGAILALRAQEAPIEGSSGWRIGVGAAIGLGLGWSLAWLLFRRAASSPPCP
jgi:hypothetical protein